MASYKIKESDYRNVNIIGPVYCEKQFDCKNFSIDLENQNIELPSTSNLIINYKLKYEVLEFIDKNQTYYQLQASLPFSFKSNWIKTNYAPNWCDYAVQRLKAELIKRYKDLIVRDYNNRKYNGLSDCQLSKIFHAPFYEEYDSSMTVAEKWKSIDSVKDISKINDITTPYKFYLSFCKFAKMLIEDNCYYCGISVEQINEISSGCKLYTKRPRGYTFEIDQIEPVKGYSDLNCEASCYWCNNAKTDEFSKDEFKNIACGINIAWNDRLQQIGSNSKVIFPWQDEVKCCNKTSIKEN